MVKLFIGSFYILVMLHTQIYATYFSQLEKLYSTYTVDGGHKSSYCQKMIKLLENDEADHELRSPDEHLNISFKAATVCDKTDLMKRFSYTMCGKTFISQETANESFAIAAVHGRKNAINWLITNSYDIRPDQEGINRGYRYTVCKNNREMSEYLFKMSKAGSISFPDQETVNYIFENGVQDTYLMEQILKRVSPAVPLPSQESLINSTHRAARWGEKYTLEWMFTRPEFVAILNQGLMNQLLEEASEGENFEVIKLLLEPHGTVPLPEQEAIKKSYDILVNKGDKHYMAAYNPRGHSGSALDKYKKIDDFIGNFLHKLVHRK
ncbi:MAG: hypothetical protein K2W94_03165 [Alphaproteobacteria bacterium]|nr:hypothetical protein [Alphaproteobacteria bacterium]